MPKKRKSKPARVKNKLVQDTASAPSRNRRLRIVAIWIILSLILSLLVGALSITPTPAGAAETPVAVSQFDTDGDGIENNLDPDIDGDGVINADDDDIDGDGKSNATDGDPAGTNGFEVEPPNIPGHVKVLGSNVETSMVPVLVAGILTFAFTLILIIRVRKKRVKTVKNSFKSDTK